MFFLSNLSLTGFKDEIAAENSFWCLSLESVKAPFRFRFFSVVNLYCRYGQIVDKLWTTDIIFYKMSLQKSKVISNKACKLTQTLFVATVNPYQTVQFIKSFQECNNCKQELVSLGTLTVTKAPYRDFNRNQKSIKGSQTGTHQERQLSGLHSKIFYAQGHGVPFGG